MPKTCDNCIMAGCTFPFGATRCQHADMNVACDDWYSDWMTNDDGSLSRD